MGVRAYETPFTARLRIASTGLFAISFGSWAAAFGSSLAGANEAGKGLILAFAVAGFLGASTWILYCVVAGPRWARHIADRVRRVRKA
ncbi:hypothetical protein ASD69_01925 [Lysobacter sp. Root604]|nr:hypothetical protein ASD69_01925 [Lysobacter sp. Root604]